MTTPLSTTDGGLQLLNKPVIADNDVEISNQDDSFNHSIINATIENNREGRSRSTEEDILAFVIPSSNNNNKDINEIKTEVITNHLKLPSSNSDDEQQQDSEKPEHSTSHKSRRRRSSLRGSLSTTSGVYSPMYFQPQHRRSSAASWAYGESGVPWSPWSGWRLGLKLLYAVFVPAVIIYLLKNMEERATNCRQERAHRHPWGAKLETTGVGSMWAPTVSPIPEGPAKNVLWSWWHKENSEHNFAYSIDDRGWVAQLSNVYQRRLDIINRGFSGYTTEQALYLLPQILPLATTVQPSDPKIQFITLFFGANDACLPHSVQHVPLDRYAENLRTLLDMVHNSSSPTYSPYTKIIVICPPPVEEIAWKAECDRFGTVMDHDSNLTKKYAETCLRVATEYAAESASRTGVDSAANTANGVRLHEIDVIDTWSIMMDLVESGERNLSDFLRDGVHLAAEGNNIIFQEIMNIIRTKYPEWNPDKMPMNGPWWRKLDRAHPETDLLICANKLTISRS
ncbi:hypothetical protein FBU30_009307 [Linnemannia zychae]|nr:hypothetical protein FBU30_009307 [Linnemannia zychae]